MPARVVVIGAGLVGAAIAADLSRAGAEVTVLEAHRPAGGTSNATFSWTNANAKQPREYHDLNVGGMLAHRRFAERFRGADWYHEGGNLEWKNDAEANAGLARKVDQLRAYHYPVRWLDRSEVVALEPDLDPALIPDNGVAYYSDEGWIQPSRLVAALLAEAKGQDARVITGTTVTSVKAEGKAVTAVVTDAATSWPADVVVDCAGPDAASVAALAGVDLPMRNTRGVLTYLQPAAVAVGRVVHAPRVHLRPDGGGRLLLHSEAVDEAATQQDGGWEVDPNATAQLLADARDLYPGIAGVNIESVRVGIRPIPSDGLPVLGRSATVDNFYLAVTHSAATLCLRIAELLTPEVLGGQESPELAPFRHDRLVVAA